MKKISGEELKKKLGAALSDDMLEAVSGGGGLKMSREFVDCVQECMDKFDDGLINHKERRQCVAECERRYG